jgi:hypothetical protein
MILASHGIVASQIASFDADAVAFFNRVTTAGGSLSATEKAAVNTLVVQMKADGIWSGMKAIYPMVGASAAACAQNLKSSSFTGTFSSGWTFASTGVTPTNAYMNTGLNPSTQLSQNSTHISSYIRNTSQGVLLGSDVSNRLWIAPNFNGTQKYLEINTGATTTPSTTISTAVGLWIGSRTTSTSSKLYNNSTTNYSHSTASNGLDNQNIFISARNTGVASNFSSAECAFASIGEGLTDTQASNLYTAVQAMQTTLSRQV